MEAIPFPPIRAALRMNTQPGRGFVKEVTRDQGYRKAAEFLTLLGRDEAARVMKHLSEDEVAGIADQIARITSIEKDKARKLLEEFGYIARTKDLVSRGGLDTAQDILVAAFGEEKGHTILNRIRARTVPHPFSFLLDLDPDQVFLMLKDESPAAVATILPHIEPGLAAQLLARYDPRMQVQIAARVARVERVSPDVLQRVEEALRDKARNQGSVVTREIDGRAALAEILQCMDVVGENAILEELSTENAELSEEIKRRLLTMDVVLSMSDVDLQSVLRDYEDREIALILRGVSEEIGARILTSVSSRRREAIRSEDTFVGSAQRSDVPRATQEFLDYLRKQNAEGAIRLVRDRDDLVP